MIAATKVTINVSVRTCRAMAVKYDLKAKKSILLGYFQCLCDEGFQPGPNGDVCEQPPVKDGPWFGDKCNETDRQCKGKNQHCSGPSSGNEVN